MKKLLTLALLAIATLIVLPACDTTRPIPPHQSGDGSRGLNPGARAQSANGANVDRSRDVRY
ncbi:MAG: hypothetical protein WCF18_23565 [Chthoniobacteraceae bacterium]